MTSRARVFLRAPFVGCAAAVVAAVCALAVGIVVLVIAQPKPAFPGDPNDGFTMGVFFIVLIVAALGFVAGLVGSLVRNRVWRQDRRDAPAA